MRRSFLSTPLWFLFQLLPSGFCFESLPWLSFVMDCKLEDETNPFFQMLLLVVMFITVIGSNLGYYTLIPLSRVWEYARDPDDILIGRHTEKNIDRGSSNNSGRIDDRSRFSHSQKLYIWHMEVGFPRENSWGEGGVFTQESCSLSVRIDSQFKITHLIFRRTLPFTACANS